MSDLSTAIQRVRAQLEQLPSAPSLSLDLTATGQPTSSLLHVQWVIRSLLGTPAPSPPVEIRTRDVVRGTPPAAWLEVEIMGANRTDERFATVKELVERGGGELHAEGALVRLFLPCRPRRILIVDDDPMVRRALSMVLTRSGYETVEAADGEQALDLAERGELDLLLSDVSMPRMGGVELAERLVARRPGLPVLLVSGTAPDTAIPFLPKPVTRTVLLRRVSELLGASGNALRKAVTPTPTAPFARLARVEPPAPARRSQTPHETSGPGAWETVPVPSQSPK